jgi:sugar lactone lactonase YvrE
MRVNAGVWGTAAFPSVYRANVHPFAFMPHSIWWQVVSFALTLSGLGVAATRVHQWAAALLLGSGLIGLAVTVVKNLAYAQRSDIASLAGRKLWYRAMVAYLHFIQPLARVRGRIRGMLAPPAVALPLAEPQTSRGPKPSLREAVGALLLLSGTVTEDRFWSETWMSADRLLSQLTDWLRRSRAVRSIEIDDGWSDDRDVSVFVGRWAWLDVRVLAEDHGSGRTLVRVSTHLRPTSFGVVTAVGLGTALLVAAWAGLSLRWPLAGAATATLTLLIIGITAWRTAQATATVRRAVSRVTLAQQMVRMRSGPTLAPIISPSRLRTYGLRSALIFVLMIVGIGTGTFMLQEAANSVRLVIGTHSGRDALSGRGNPPNVPTITAWLNTPGGIAITANGDIYFADSNNDVIDRVDRRLGVMTTFVGNRTNGFSGDNGPATKAQLDSPDGVAIAPDGDLIVADSHNDRIRRVDDPTRVITTIAGSGKNGYDGDDKPAIDAALNNPNAVATVPNGDIYVADTLNNRIRVIDHATGLIHTVAGDGQSGGDGPIGDGGPATSAHLFMPSDVQIASNGDIYIADMHHNRVRKVDAVTRIISTVAGNGVFGAAGDNGPATNASLAGPAGLALVEDVRGRLTIFVADSYNGTVRAVDVNGVMRNVSDEGGVKFGAPSRVAFAAGTGWLYVADSSNHQVVALNVPVALLSLGPRGLGARGLVPAASRGSNRRAS